VFHFVTHPGHSEVVTKVLVVDSGADSNAADSDSRTTLRLAAAEDLKLLLLKHSVQA